VRWQSGPPMLVGLGLLHQQIQTPFHELLNGKHVLTIILLGSPDTIIIHIKYINRKVNKI
jgi:hypothetical protein